jgi:hypothetical protein
LIRDFTIFTTPVGVHRVYYLDKITTNDNTPQLAVSITDDRGELDWTSPKVFFTDKDGNTLDVTQNSDIIINYVDPDGRTGPLEYGYWAGSMSYEPTEPLAHGTYTIRFEVKDMAGNLASEVYHFNIDNIPPSLPDDFIVPHDMYSTTESEITISGKTDPFATVIIRGINVTADDKGEFNVDIILEPGINDISIQVIDWFDQDIAGNLIPGNSQSTTRRIIYDTVPPLIKDVTNSTGSPTRDEFVEISGKVEDYIGNSTLQYPWLPTDVTVRVNGKLTEVLSDGIFTESVVLAEGLNTIVLEAVDEADNKFFYFLNITRDLTKPILTIEHLPTESNVDIVVVGGTVEIGSTVLINGKYVPSIGGIFLEEITLSEGLNTIKVEAIDDAGNVNDITRYITYSPQEQPKYLFYGLLAFVVVIMLLLGFAIGRIFSSRKKPEKIKYIEEEIEEEPEKAKDDEPDDETVNEEIDEVMLDEESVEEEEIEKK